MRQVQYFLQLARRQLHSQIFSARKATTRTSQSRIGTSLIRSPPSHLSPDWGSTGFQCRMAVASGARTFGEALRAALIAASSFLISLRDCDISFRASIASRCLWVSGRAMLSPYGFAEFNIHAIQVQENRISNWRSPLQQVQQLGHN